MSHSKAQPARNGNHPETPIVEVMELIKEDPGDVKIEEILGMIPKGKDAAENLIIKLQDHIKNELLEEKELEVKKKKANELVKNTDPMKALKKLKAEIKLKKKTNERMLLILIGCKKMAKAMGVKINFKELQLTS